MRPRAASGSAEARVSCGSKSSILARVLVRTTCLALVLICACIPRPPPAPPRETRLGLEISTRTLPSGLRVVVVDDPNAAAVHVTMRYRIGAIDDGEHPGMAHLVEHLMFQQVLDGQSLFTHLEDNATYFNAATTLDATTYVTRAPARELDRLLAIEAVRLEDRCKTITDAAFEREREVVINELKQRDQATEVYAVIHRALYPDGHAYRQSAGGSIESVGAITRDQACKFVDSYYSPRNAVLVISGSFQGPDVEASLGKLGTRITGRYGATPRQVHPVRANPHYVEAPAPVDEDMFVLAWPLPYEPELQAKVRAVAAAVPRLVDAEIKGSVVAVELGDRSAPMIGIAVLPGEGETYQQAAQGARRGIEKLPGVFRDRGPQNIDEVVFDRIKQSAIYNLYSSLEDGSSRDDRLASYVIAGSDPNAAIAAEFRALRALTRDEGAWIATSYLAVDTPTGITLKASPGKKRGDKVTLRAPIHDMGQRRTPPDPALARRPAEGTAAHDVAGVETRVLPNGLKVVLLPLTTVPTFDARLIFGSGTAAEPTAQRGVALLAAHTLTWDLHYLNDLFPFARAGGMRNTDVTTDRTTFSVQGLDMNLDVVLAGLRRWVREGTYDDSAASFVTAMQRATKRVDDQGPLTDAWRAALFGPRHPYVQAGIARHVNNALTLDDAARFRAAYYAPDNATLVIAGRFDAALADRWIDYLFADWQGHGPARASEPSASQPASIAKVDDVALVQLRIAIPADATRRAQELVAAAMLDEIVHDVRHRLGASYTLDADLTETRLASFLMIAGWVDTARAAEAIELIRDRIAELRTNEDAAARAFVTARGHVLVKLGSQVGSAGALAARVEQDIELARAPMSDLHTGTAVQKLTLADMTATLATLDLARATVLMNGPAAELASAFQVLGRTPVYIQKPSEASYAGPGATAPAFVSAEQQVRTSDLARSLTEQLSPELMLTIFPSWSAANYGEREGGVLLPLTGYSLAADVGYRFGLTTAIGAHLSIGRLVATAPDQRFIEMTAINALGFVHLEGDERFWTDLMLGLHLDRVSDITTQSRTALLAGIQLGADLWTIGTRRLGIAARLESSLSPDVGYSSLSLGLVLRQ
jgi:zinc protease